MKKDNWWNRIVINGFFGWENFKWFIIQIRATFSNEPSYFSRKRIESYMLFVGAFSSTMFYIWKNINVLLYHEMLAMSGALFFYAGYTMQVIQKEKKEEVKSEETK